LQLNAEYLAIKRGIILNNRREPSASHVDFEGQPQVDGSEQLLKDFSLPPI